MSSSLGVYTLNPDSINFGEAQAITDLKLGILPVTVEYAERLSGLPPHHKDPFDRLMIAQALVDGIAVVGVDAAFDAYGVSRIW